MCEAEMYVYETLDLTIFESLTSYTWYYYLVILMGLNCLFWSWWCYFVTYLTWPFLSLWSILFWDTFWLLIENRWVLWFTLRYFLITHWELMDIVIYHLMFFSCSWRTNVILWNIFWCSLVTCIKLRWFYYDFLICDFMTLE